MLSSSISAKCIASRDVSLAGKPARWSCVSSSCKRLKYCLLSIHMHRLRSPQSLPVLLFIILSIFPAFNFFPPPFVVRIPLNRIGEGLLERVARLPAERARFGEVERIAAVMPGTVLDTADKFWRLVERVQNNFYNLEVVPFVVAANVVGFAHFALMQYYIYGFAVVGDVEPIADLHSIAVEGERFIF